MNGHILPRTPVAVDFWKIRRCPQVKVFFLSHCHADHTAGLSSTWHRPIYCSEVTAQILQHKFHIQDQYIRPLEFNRGYLIPLDDKGSHTMTVTLIDANHCPGATMFLFEGYFGTVLYTADFRFHGDMFKETPLSQKRDINVLYLDNTYCNPSCVFPTRQKCEEDIIDIIRCNQDADVVIGIRNLGKEDLLVKIAQTFDEWIGVSANMHENAEILELPNVFTTDLSICRIRTEPLHSISNKRIQQWNQRGRTVVILPTAIYNGIDGSPFVNQKDVHVVPYSDHSSYSELHKFVLKIKPNHIIPIVGASARGPFGTSLERRADMSCFKHYLAPSPVPGFDIPDTVKQFMSHLITDTFCITRRQNHKIQQLRKTNSSKSRGCALGVVFLDSPGKSCEEPSIPSDDVQKVAALKIGACNDDHDNLIDPMHSGHVKPLLRGAERDESVEELNSKIGNSACKKANESSNNRSRPVFLNDSSREIEIGCSQKADRHSVELVIEENESKVKEPMIGVEEVTGSDFVDSVADRRKESDFVDPMIPVEEKGPDFGDLMTDDGGAESESVDTVITADGGTESNFVDTMITVDGGTESDFVDPVPTVDGGTESGCMDPVITADGGTGYDFVDPVTTVDGWAKSDSVDPADEGTERNFVGSSSTVDGGTESGFMDPLTTVDGETESDYTDPLITVGETNSVDPVITVGETDSVIPVIMVDGGTKSHFVDPTESADGKTDSDAVDHMIRVDGRTQFNYGLAIQGSTQPPVGPITTEAKSICPLVSTGDVFPVQVNIENSPDISNKEQGPLSGITCIFPRSEKFPNHEEQEGAKNKSNCAMFANGSAQRACTSKGVKERKTLTRCEEPFKKRLTKRKRDHSFEHYLSKRPKILHKMDNRIGKKVTLATNIRQEMEETGIVEMRNTSKSDPRLTDDSVNEGGNSTMDIDVGSSIPEMSCQNVGSDLGNTRCRSFTSTKLSVIPVSQRSGRKRRRKMFVKMLTKLLE